MDKCVVCGRERTDLIDDQCADCTMDDFWEAVGRPRKFAPHGQGDILAGLGLLPTPGLDEPLKSPTEREIAAGYMRWSHSGLCPKCGDPVKKHRGSHPLDKNWDYCTRCGWGSDTWTGTD